jgi:pilus assembly protein CpaF
MRPMLAVPQDLEERIERDVLDLQQRERAQSPAEVLDLIERVVNDYLDRGVAVVTDPRGLIKAVADRIIGFGPLQSYFEDPTVEEIWINEPGKVFVARAGRPELTTTVLTQDQVKDLVELMLRESGRRVDLSSPFVDATLPDGSRLHVVIPDITRRYWAVNIRKFVLRANSLQELIRLGTMSLQCARLLEAAVVAGLNIVVAGATQAGKTTLLSCLAAAIPPRERVITCEEVFELQVRLPDVVAMQTRPANLEGEGEIRQRRLVKEALRMRPNRVIVGEVREAECLDLLIALNSGFPGMTSIHANSAREALVKLTTLPLLAGENVSYRFIAPTVAATIDLIVFLRSDTSGRRRVEEVLGVSGRVEDEDKIEAGLLFQRDTDGRLGWTGEYPPHRDRFVHAGYDLVKVLEE